GAAPREEPGNAHNTPPVSPPPPGAPPPVAAEIEILPDRQVGKDAAPLGHMDKPARDDRRGLLSLDRAAGEPDGAVRRAQHARDGAVERRLPRSVRAEHRDDLAGGDL